MVNWQLLTDAGALADWDKHLLSCGDYSIYQTIAWGEHRRALGWTPYRWIATDESGKISAMAQGLLRRYRGRVGVLWLPGGPVGLMSAWADGLQPMIRRSTGQAFLYCRFNSFRPVSPGDDKQLSDAGWQRPRVRLTSGQSMLYDLARPEAERIAASSKNWRHNLKRSRKGAFTVSLWEKPDAAEMRTVYAEMEDYKSLSQQHSEQNLRALYEHVGKHLVTYCCRDASGRLLSFRACAIFGDRAWDMLAATAVAGRKSYASYATFWALTEECHRRGVRQYDLSGIDPVGNRGVYDFKQGTGAAPVQFIGEREWAAPRLFALPANWMIGARRNAI